MNYTPTPLLILKQSKYKLLISCYKYYGTLPIFCTRTGISLIIIFVVFRLNPLSLVQMCMPIIEQFKDKEEAFQFLEKLGEKVKADTEAFSQTKVLQGKIQLDCFNNIEKTKVS